MSFFKQLKVITYVLFTVFALSFVLIGIAPSILSSSWGQKHILSHLNKKLASGVLSFDDLELNWQGPQKIHNFTLVDNANQTILNVETAEIQSTLIHLLFNDFEVSDLKISKLNLSITPDPIQKTTNLEQVIGKPLFPYEILDSKVLDIVDCQASITYTPSTFVLKTTGSTRYGNTKGDFNIDLEQNQQRLRWSAKVDRFPVPLLDAIVALKVSSMHGVLIALLGDTITLNASETMINDNATFRVHTLSPLVTADITGKYDSNGLSLTSPASMKLKITPELQNALIKSNIKQWSLAEPIEMELTIPDLNFPFAFLTRGLDTDELENWSLKSELRIPQMTINNLQQSDLNAYIKELVLHIDTPKKEQKFAFQFQGTVSMAIDTVDFDVSSSFPKPKTIAEVKNSLINPSNIHLAFEDLPTSILDYLFGTKSSLKSMMGPEVSFQVETTGNDLNSLKFSVQSANLNLTDVVLILDQPLNAASSLMAQNLSGQITVKKFDFPHIQPISEITNIAIPWSYKEREQSFNASLSAQTQIAGNEEKGSIDGNVRLMKFTSDNPMFELSCKGRKIPTTLVKLISSRSEASTLFGSSIDLDIQHRNDKLYADVIGNLGKVRLRSRIKDGILTLEEPFVASFTATPDLGSQILGKAMPLFKGLLSAQKPITISVDPAKFYFPIASPDLTNIQIGQATVDAGKMQFSNSGELEKLLKLLNLQSGKEISIWATPLYLSLNEGVLSVSRMDMLFQDHYQVAIWGNVDFAKDQVDMVIGIPGQTLSYALQVPKMDKEYMLQLPLKGRTRNAKIDQSKAATRIAALLAKQQEGTEGLVLGAVLDLTNGKQAKVPQPTTSPFPWNDQQTSMPPQDQKDENLGTKKIKIEKTAAKLLNKFLK